jgi:hypothetical protein
MDFFGLNFSAEGIKLQKSKVDAIIQELKELRSLLGLVSFCSKFIPEAGAMIAAFRSFNSKGEK